MLFHLHWERPESRSQVDLSWVQLSLELSWVESRVEPCRASKQATDRSHRTAIATIPFAQCHTTKHMPFLYVYFILYSLFILVIIINVAMCGSLLLLLLLLPLLPLLLLLSFSLSHSLFSSIFFEVSFRFLLVFCVCLSLCFVFVQFERNFNYFKVTRKSTASQLYAVVEVKRFIREIYTLDFGVRAKTLHRLLIADFYCISFDLVLLRFYSFQFVTFYK